MPENEFHFTPAREPPKPPSVWLPWLYVLAAVVAFFAIVLAVPTWVTGSLRVILLVFKIFAHH